MVCPVKVILQRSVKKKIKKQTKEKKKGKKKQEKGIEHSFFKAVTFSWQSELSCMFVKVQQFLRAKLRVCMLYFG